MTKECKRALFTAPEREQQPFCYFTLPCADTPDARAAICTAVERCRNDGFSTLIAEIAPETVLNSAAVAILQAEYALLLREAEAKDIQIGIALCPAFEALVLTEHPELRAKILECKEYVCSSEEKISRRLRDGDRLSLVAFSEEYCEIIDLREFVEDNKLCWQAPKGNYVVREYFALPDNAREAVNLLSYETSFAYIEAVFALFRDTFAPYLEKTLSLLAFSEIGFGGANHRAWEPSFNDLFEKRFGADPAPLYPALFGYIGPNTDHCKAALMSVRAELLQNGILKALADFTAQNGLTLFATLNEPKLTAPSLTVGDAMLAGAISPCALFDKAYMYGTNSVKVAAGAAYNFDIERVNAELFRSYSRHDSDRLYKDAMNAFARGVNSTALHLYDDIGDHKAFSTFISRVQTLLRGGSHVADIAMLYPVHDLHSHAGLYFSPHNGYEYPATPPTADYMTLLNSISIYSGHDLTLLHPEVMAARCRAEGGVLYLDNERNKESFRVVVLPGCEMISLPCLRLLHAFFEGGGKVLATGVLPTKAFEYDTTGENDREVRRLTRQIFGKDACNPRLMRDYCHNESPAGGEAFFLYFNASAADGTRMTHSSTVNEALNSFSLPFDIYLPAMPRLECTGALNSIFPEYRTIGLHRSFPGGGMLNHIHKRKGGCDIYYFSNTTQTPYNHHVLLRGAFDIEEWNPHSGAITARTSKLFRYRGELYTDLRLTLAPCASLFFVGTPRAEMDGEIEEISSILNLQSPHAALMSEF
ncbi:MAG: hypothetical protein IKD28_02945 [Clostridia bacterium]|nr:hypothetical protein [Clostridia bacterium]